METINQVRQEEWRNAKTHYSHLGKYGHIARMVNPKTGKGQTASNTFPIMPNEAVRKGINNEERKEASIITHTMWMDDPPGIKNFYFLDITKNEIGPNGISIHAEKTFNEDAQWKYLEGILEEKLDNETATRVNIAHQRLRALFKKIKLIQRSSTHLNMIVLLVNMYMRN
jgi:hypothetical protein